MIMRQSVVTITAAIRHHFNVEEAKEMFTPFPPYTSYEPEALFKYYLADCPDPYQAMVSALLDPNCGFKGESRDWKVHITDNPLLAPGSVQVLDLEHDMYSRRSPPMWVNVGTVGHCNMPPVHFKGNKHVKL